MNKNVVCFAFVVLTLVAAPVLAFAANNADQEITMAATHAQFAADAANLHTAVMHFHHVINCLVGPKSELFDAAVGNPCKDMGNGALNDIGQNSTERVKLQRALSLAIQALHAKDLKATQEFSARIRKVLKSVSLDE